MNQAFSTQYPNIYTKILPWLHFLGAVAVVVLHALYSAVHSDLGYEISAGESPGFAWIRAHVNIGMGLGLVYLIAVCRLQMRQLQHLSTSYARLLKALGGLEMLCIAAIGLSMYYHLLGFLPPIQTALLLSILIQGLFTYWNSGLLEFDWKSEIFQRPEKIAGRFLFLLFLTGAALALLDPSAQRMTEHIYLDSEFEYRLMWIFPPILAGITSLWFGTGMLIILFFFSRFVPNIMQRPNSSRIIPSLLFIPLVALITAILCGSLLNAIDWELGKLNLKPVVLQLFLLSSIGGGVLLAAVFCRITVRMPQAKKVSLVGIVSFIFGAAIILPITWLLTMRRSVNVSWRVLLLSVLGASGLIVYLTLFANIFNPWFTAFSFLKGIILKLISMVAAGTVLLLFSRLSLGDVKRSWNLRQWTTLSVLALLFGFLPFYAIGKYPEVKAVTLQFNELTRVDAAFAGKLGNMLGLGRWIQLGQQPAENGYPHPWPQPWKLKRTHPSLLPEDFNLLIIVVDALRGDAFHSAGYQRNLTPFLDRWALAEAISFRRAYSQGGGSFAAFPFLVAGRSRFTLYGPGLYAENLYLKLSKAEGIKHFMVMKDFGPRGVFPPDAPVIELGIPRAVSDRRSATADEVFDSARRAIGAVPQGERFLCFLHLMDVHNDLWKKDGGIDFGDSPRDLYDNNLSYLDRAFEQFVNWLRQNGLYERTVILFTSDHGEQFWEHGASLHGHTLYEEEIQIPLIFFAHGLRGRFEDVPVIAADMAPTITELAGYSIAPPY
ncbi:MAG: sulfatase-like hydrolase/transferase, partial [Deltaproteobacteria bacterium]|nr:sulfatase-like hydrolase/transferase [Deltaproteobacteria bacterium]